MAAAQTITLSMLEPDIALLTFDMPDKGANVLSMSVLAELSAHLDDLEKRANLAGLVIRSGKPGTFIAGADLREFAAGLKADAAQVVETCRITQRSVSFSPACHPPHRTAETTRHGAHRPAR